MVKKHTARTSDKVLKLKDEKDIPTHFQTSLEGELRKNDA